MSATLLAVIIALAIGHLAPGIANGLRQFGWYRSWLQWLNAQFPEDSVWRGSWGIALALVGNFDSVLSAWRQDGAFGLDSRLLPNAARASVRSEIAEEVGDYAESGISASTALAEVFGELPELRDAMNLAWRVLVLWLAVIALFVVAGWVS